MFAVYPILRSDAACAEGMLAAYNWAEIAREVNMPRFRSLRTVRFVPGKALDYTRVSGAFVDLEPLLRKIILKDFKVRSRIDVVFGGV